MFFKQRYQTVPILSLLIGLQIVQPGIAFSQPESGAHYVPVTPLTLKPGQVSPHISSLPEGGDEAQVAAIRERALKRAGIAFAQAEQDTPSVPHPPQLPVMKLLATKEADASEIKTAATHLTPVQVPAESVKPDVAQLTVNETPASAQPTQKPISYEDITWFTPPVIPTSAKIVAARNTVPEVIVPVQLPPSHTVSDRIVWSAPPPPQEKPAIQIVTAAVKVERAEMPVALPAEYAALDDITIPIPEDVPAIIMVAAAEIQHLPQPLPAPVDLPKATISYKDIAWSVPPVVPKELPVDRAQASGETAANIVPASVKTESSESSFALPAEYAALDDIAIPMPADMPARIVVARAEPVNLPQPLSAPATQPKANVSYKDIAWSAPPLAAKELPVKVASVATELTKPTEKIPTVIKPGVKPQRAPAPVVRPEIIAAVRKEDVVKIAVAEATPVPTAAIVTPPPVQEIAIAWNTGRVDTQAPAPTLPPAPAKVADLPKLPEKIVEKVAIVPPPLPVEKMEAKPVEVAEKSPEAIQDKLPEEIIAAAPVAASDEPDRMIDFTVASAKRSPLIARMPSKDETIVSDIASDNIKSKSMSALIAQDDAPQSADDIKPVTDLTPMPSQEKAEPERLAMNYALPARVVEAPYRPRTPLEKYRPVQVDKAADFSASDTVADTDMYADIDVIQDDNVVTSQGDDRKSPAEAWADQQSAPENEPVKPASTAAKVPMKDIIVMALRHHPTIARSQATRDLYEASLADLDGQQKAQLTGFTDMSGDYDTTGSSDTRFSNALTAKSGVRLNYLLYNFGASKKRHNAGEQTLEQATLQLQESRESVAFDVISAYLEVMRQKDMLDIEDFRIKEHMDFLRLVEAAAKDDQVLQSQLFLARTGLAQRRQSYLNVERELKQAIFALQRLTGATFAADQFDRPSTPIIILPEEDEFIAMGMDSSPEVAALEKAVNAAQFQRDAAKKDQYGAVNVNMNVASDRKVIGEERKTQAAGSFLLEYSVPLYTGGSNQAKQKQATASILQTKADLRSTQDSLKEQLRLAYYAIQQNEEILSLSKTEEDYAMKTLTAYKGEIAYGGRSFSDVVAQIDSVAAARGRAISARVSKTLAAFAIIRRQGSLLAHLKLQDVAVDPQED